MQESDIPKIIEGDAGMMAVLRAVRTLELPDWWIGAGFVRNKIWDVLHGRDREPSGDIDVVYFDDAEQSEDTEKGYERRLEELCPTGKWSVTNQARMAAFNHDEHDEPYTSTVDAMAHWPETATAVGVTLDDAGHVVFMATHGADDLLGLIVRSTSTRPEKLARYRERMMQKDWQTEWPKLKIV